MNLKTFALTLALSTASIYAVSTALLPVAAYADNDGGSDHDSGGNDGGSNHDSGGNDSHNGSDHDSGGSDSHNGSDHESGGSDDNDGGVGQTASSSERNSSTHCISGVNCVGD